MRIRPRERYMPPKRHEEKRPEMDCPEKPDYPTYPMYPMYPMHPPMGCCPLMDPMMMRCVMMCMSHYGRHMNPEDNCKEPVHPPYPMHPCMDYLHPMYPIMPIMDEEEFMQEE